MMDQVKALVKNGDGKKWERKGNFKQESRNERHRARPPLGGARPNDHS